MKNKHFLFSISLAISIAVIMVLSIFIHSTIFDGIAQAITIPFLLFTFISCIFSIVEEIVYICKTKMSIEEERMDCWKYYKNTLETQLSVFKKYDNPQTEAQFETNMLLDQRKQQLENAKSTLEACSLNYLAYGEIVNKCQKDKILKIFYVISLTILIVSMMIAPIISPYCSFIPTTTLPLLSLFFAIMEILIKEKVATSIFTYLHNKTKKCIQERSNARK